MYGGGGLGTLICIPVYNILILCCAIYYFSSSRQLVFEDAGSHGNTENIPPQLMDQLQPVGLHTNQSLNTSRTPNSCNTSQKNAESFDKVRAV